MIGVLFATEMEAAFQDRDISDDVVEKVADEMDWKPHVLPRKNCGNWGDDDY